MDYTLSEHLKRICWNPFYCSICQKFYSFDGLIFVFHISHDRKTILSKGFYCELGHRSIRIFPQAWNRFEVATRKRLKNYRYYVMLQNSRWFYYIDRFARDKMVPSRLVPISDSTKKIYMEIYASEKGKSFLRFDRNNYLLEELA